MTRIEDTILKNLIFNDEYTRKSLPYLKKEYFTDHNDKFLFEEIENYVNNFNVLPTKEALIIEVGNNSKLTEDQFTDVSKKVKGQNFKKALITIIIADVSMSLDNVIAVTAIAREKVYLLIFGIAFSIFLIAVFATAIVGILTEFRWLSYIGLGFLIYLSTEMAIDGFKQVQPFL